MPTNKLRKRCSSCRVRLTVDRMVNDLSGRGYNRNRWFCVSCYQSKHPDQTVELTGTNHLPVVSFKGVQVPEEKMTLEEMLIECGISLDD